MSLLRGADAVRPGHLVAIVDGQLVDTTLEQANRPAKNIILPPVLVAKAPVEFLLGREKFYLHGDGGLLIYQPNPDRSWRNAPDWTDRERHRRSINRILELIR